MVAAISITVLFIISYMIVRVASVASVAMRHTGLPDNVARFQCVSALTGTGFTTSESEMIVNYPVRRRILAALMVLGNLGIVSVAATFIVTFVEIEPKADVIAWQIALIGSSLLLTLVAMTNKKVDEVLCDFIGCLLEKATSLGKHRFQRLLEVADSFCVAEHLYRGTSQMCFDTLSSDVGQISLLAIRKKRACNPLPSMIKLT